MKKALILLLSLVMIFAFAACGGGGGEPDEPDNTASDWAAEGSYEDDAGNYLNISAEGDDEEEHEGWYVNCILNEVSYSGYIAQDNESLQGTLSADEGSGEVTVTITEAEEDELLLTTDGGEEYHLIVMDTED